MPMSVPQTLNPAPQEYLRVDCLEEVAAQNLRDYLSLWSSRPAMIRRSKNVAAHLQVGARKTESGMAAGNLRASLWLPSQPVNQARHSLQGWQGCRPYTRRHKILLGYVTRRRLKTSKPNTGATSLQLAIHVALHSTALVKLGG